MPTRVRVAVQPEPTNSAARNLVAYSTRHINASRDPPDGDFLFEDVVDGHRAKGKTFVEKGLTNIVDREVLFA
jgi:hypothetical protein